MGPSIASGPPDAEEDERGSPMRKAATTINTATAEENCPPRKFKEQPLTVCNTCIVRAGGTQSLTSERFMKEIFNFTP